MSIHLPPPTQFGEPLDSPENDSSSSESEEEEDQTWDDWQSDSITQQCKSLFDEKVFQSIEETLEYDKEKHHFVLEDVCKALSLDFHKRVRLINFIRKNNSAPTHALVLTGNEPWFSTDEYLVPVIENDPLIQSSFNDWSDDEEVDNGSDPRKKIHDLEQQLARARQSFLEYRVLISEKLDITKDIQSVHEDFAQKPSRDDDTHYFESYEANDIHAVMIQDKVRTSTYAKFILSNPTLFRDAVVLDVGCGTGILSLFAARAGAKRVIAVDASDIALKAEKIVKENGFENVITVVKGKIEDITMPEGVDKVDIIISEWMGYALLYESMLDSVLVARDRFLRSGGIMAPSQSQMMVGLCDASEIWKDRIGFWDDVYGFDLSVMSSELYDEAIVDVVGPETLLCKAYPVKDFVLSDVSPRDLDFASSFTLSSTADQRTKVSAFVLYFDTYFSPSGHPIPPSTEVTLVKEGEVSLAEMWPVGGKPAHKRRQSSGKGKENVTSFSTGPHSSPTHWKQTIFMLREPFMVSEGSLVVGRFLCTKNEKNSRELNVEIHYSVKDNESSQPGPTVVQFFKVR
ncbi:protein arginine N-methyltransferase [Crepidotus variabilis]|uniref:type I protein arginine methyltransferase n=1 Tax=Crepidotus variabilis TaxID=179855 RepID=A0A9P6EAL1_9AGAR|nr:protein arginine N-methyltransferase [Crepidotus variabilis]